MHPAVVRDLARERSAEQIRYAVRHSRGHANRRRRGRSTERAGPAVRLRMRLAR